MRSLAELYEDIRDFTVVEEEGRIVGCCALHIIWEDLGEIRSLAVAGDSEGKGWGSQLVQACIDEARELALVKLIALTVSPDFFIRQGFQMIDKAEVPQKIWSECFHCPRFPNCNEEALILRLDQPRVFSTPIWK